MNDQLSFQNGSRLTIIASQGKILAYYEGVVIQSGQSLVLERFDNRKLPENGLRINEQFNLFEGDIIITMKDERLRAILHIGIEDYLKGVVPYEMSDSFPLEALKAQAVAARSYAVKGLRIDREYDLTDNTNDQVFKGYSKETENTLRAVQETSGLVLTYEGNIIRTYYTASNGGQTESSANAWIQEPTPYLIVRSDPYDEENPDSLVREISLPKKWKAESSKLLVFEKLLKEIIAERIVSMGYDSNPLFIKIDEILDLEANTPRFGDESLLMTELEINLAVSGRRKIFLPSEDEVSLFTVNSNTPTPRNSPQPEEEWGEIQKIEKPITLLVEIFPTLEKILELSINLKENEIVRIINDNDEFIIRFSRYGHGVGMSQRGAQWMAKQYGKNYSDILSYYYPGTAQSTYETIPAVRPELDLVYMTTPGPIPTATPKPTLVPQSASAATGQWEVIISGIQKNSSLNLRLLPSLTSDVINQLFYGQRLLVLERVDDEWLHVRADGIEGYVKESFAQRLP